MNKRVLLTNFSITNFSGSELDTVSIANYFLRNNYDVTIFTLEYGYPLFGKINKKIKLIDYDNVDKLEDFYDLIWSHHYPLLDYVLFKLKVKANHIIYISLSSFMAYESLPIYYKDLSCVSVLSEEAKTAFLNDGYDMSNIGIFPNYSYESYFKYNNMQNNHIKKICIVSNHIPQELLDFKDIAEKNKIAVDIYGIYYKYVKVDEKILSKYDVVISIGKTVQYALSLKIPVYCYDRFGGDGYITCKNFEKSLEYNFSGRYLKSKKTGENIYNEIIDNYDIMLEERIKVHELSYNTFCFEKIMNDTLNKVFATKKFDLDYVLDKYKWYARRSSLFVETVGGKVNLIKNYYYPMEFCQIYYDFGNNFCEEDSILIPFERLGDNKYKVKFKIPKNVKRIRIDFSKKIFTLVKNVYVNKKRFENLYYVNCVKYCDDYLSINDDPSILIDRNDFKGNVVSIVVDMLFLDSFDFISNLIDDNNNLRNDLYKANNRKFVKIINKVKSFFNKK